MASAEMPGTTPKAATSTPSKKPDLLVAAGRRKLDEFRKKRAAVLKNKAAEKPVSTNVHSEGLANGPIVEGNGGQSGENGQDARPVSVLKEDRRESSSQDMPTEQESIGESHRTRSITKDSFHRGSPLSMFIPASAAIVLSQPEGDSAVKVSEENFNSASMASKITSQNHDVLTGSGREHLSWMAQEAENRGRLKVFEEHSSGDSHDSRLFSYKESAEVVSDGPLHSRTVVDSWKRPNETMRRDFSHESFPMLRQETNSDTSVLSLATSIKDGIAGNKHEELNSQYRPLGISNGRITWDPKEMQFSFSQQPKKLPFSDVAEREPLFPSRLLDKSPFEPLSANRPPSPALPSPTNHQEGASLSLFAPDNSTEDALLNREKELKTHSQQEGTQKHAEHDDFGALEQHIDDLTQEKFALQRALEAARSLAESLSQQNSALTEDFNSQGAMINQLQEDLEKKKEEVMAQSLVLSSLMMERERAQQENNSAVERSQLLAGEVIGLEEKVLRLRSSELKLQKELETLRADNDSFRVQLTTLDKDRQNLRTMLEALQEDKKLLNSQVQKAFIGGDSYTTVNAKEGPHRDARDVSTSTEDLVLQTENTEALLSVDTTRVQAGEATSSSMPVSGPIPDSLGFGVPSAYATLSADDFRAINSIDTLISELFSEKEALLESLRRESARATEFESLSNELSKKLETQTQRLELAVAQSMAYGGNAVTANSMEIEPQDNEYVDEGDEVVERVLGWIMRIFPGGSSRRQSSKLL